MENRFEDEEGAYSDCDSTGDVSESTISCGSKGRDRRRIFKQEKCLLTILW